MEETEYIMQMLAQGITEFLNKTIEEPQMGFALLVFEFHKPGMSNYISNAARDTMIEALKETIERLESGEDIPTTIGGMQ